MNCKEMIEAATECVLDECYIVDDLDDVKFCDLAKAFDKLGVLVNRDYDILEKLDQEADQ